jgi:hypothetical protein
MHIFFKKDSGKHWNPFFGHTHQEFRKDRCGLRVFNPKGRVEEQASGRVGEMAQYFSMLNQNPIPVTVYKKGRF